MPDIAAVERATWDAILATNLTGPMLLMKHAAKHLAARYAAGLPPGERDAGMGAVVNMSSIRAMQSRQPNYAYSASKAGLIGITHDLAMSLGPAIRVNAIAPGWIATRAYLDEEATATRPTRMQRSWRRQPTTTYSSDGSVHRISIRSPSHGSWKEGRGWDRLDHDLIVSSEREKTEGPD